MKQILAIVALGILMSCSDSTSQEEQVIGSISSNIQKAEVIPADRSTESVSTESSIELEKSSEIKDIEQEEEPTFELSQRNPEEDIAITNFHEYEGYNTFLNKHVSPSGKVNYNAAKANMKDLDAIINEFKRNLPESTWTKNQKLAYWINAYNLFTIKLVASNYPVSSIKDITEKPWDKVFIELGTKKLSLNDIEHKEIRSKYNEPRIHFALNCASESCPKLLNKAYLATTLNSQLTQSTKHFLNDSSKNDLSNLNSIKVSQLFDWYKTDFDKDGNVIVFINKYISTPIVDTKISYLDYSWKLNN